MAGTFPTYLETYEERPRRRWRRRLLVTAIVFLVVLVGLLVVADRAATGVAERAIADQVRQRIADQDIRSSSPEVTVGGFPFLTQVIAGRYESISIVLRDVRGGLDAERVRLPKLDIEAHGVAASLETLRSGQGDVVAETVTGTGIIAYDSVAKLIDRPGVRLTERDGQLLVTAPLEVLGRQFTLTGTAKLAVSDGAVRVRFDQLTADGLPQVDAAKSLINAYAEQISVDVPLPDLPFHLDLRQVRALPAGLAVTVSGDDVLLNAVG